MSTNTSPLVAELSDDIVSKDPAGRDPVSPANLTAETQTRVNVAQRELDGLTVISLVFESVGEKFVLSRSHGDRFVSAIQRAAALRVPFVAELTTSSVSVDDGLAPLDSWARVAKELTSVSGVIPTVFIVNGPMVAGPALLLGLADVCVFVEDTYAFVTGPKSVEAYTGEPVTGANLGGAGVHARTTGLASSTVDSVESAYEFAADVLSFLPPHVDSCVPGRSTNDPFDRLTPEAGELMPTTAMGSYDVRDVIESLADDGEFLELKASWAPNMVIGFSSVGGTPIGVIGNQTQALAGSIDIPASQKGARFVAMCDAFNVPLLTLVDTSGFLPGKDLEWRGMIRHGAQLAFAYARATVPRVGLILRKSYGGAYIVMDSTEMGNDVMFAWPSAEVAVMGAKGAVSILHRKASAEEQQELVKEYEATLLTPYPAADRQAITSVIDPADTRKELIAAFAMLSSKRETLRRRQHDNGPL